MIFPRSHLLAASLLPLLLFNSNALANDKVQCNRVAEDHLRRCFEGCAPPPISPPIDFELCRTSCLSDERDEAKKCCSQDDADPEDCKVADCKREIFDRYGWLIFRFCLFAGDPISQATCLNLFTNAYMELADRNCRQGLNQ